MIPSARVEVGVLPPGFFEKEELAALSELARGRRVLEIGSLWGRSTIAMARVASLVVSVDHHLGDPDTRRQPTLHAFLENLDGYGVRERVVPVITSSEIAREIVKGPFDLVLVDADHSEEAAYSDLCWALEIAPLVAVHDLPSFAGVVAAVRRTGKSWRPLAGNLGLVQR